MDLTKEEFIEWTNGLWTIKPETRSEHPAPFPIELVTRLIKMNTYIGDIVLDPFCGSGTAAVAAINLGRRFIGIDQSEKYIQMTTERLEKHTNINISKQDYF